MTDVLTQIAALVKAEAGLAARPDVLVAALARTAPGLEPHAFLDAVQRGFKGRPLLLRLVDELTINETYFCRERGQLDAIPWRMLHEAALARGSGRVRVWSAACSSGEEAYSLGISAWEALGPEAPPIEILGTDIAPSMVLRARGGRYRSRSVREIDATARARWLVQVGDEWEVVPELRRLVTFGVHNLLHDGPPLQDEQRFDLILCRNVLIYFDDTMSRDAATRLREALHPGGLLVLGSADALGETTRALDAITKLQSARSVPERVLRPVKLAAKPAVDEPVAADADACFVRGVQHLEQGAGEEAVRWFRQALWLDGSFGLAVFALGRAYDLLGDHAAATSAYRRALRTLGEESSVPHTDDQEISVDDVVAACHARLSVLEGVGSRR